MTTVEERLSGWRAFMITSPLKLTLPRLKRRLPICGRSEGGHCGAADGVEGGHRRVADGVERDIAGLRTEIYRVNASSVKWLVSFMAGFMVVGLGGFTAIYRFLG